MSIAKVLATSAFGLVAAIQAVRYFQAWPVSINGYSVPVSASAIAAVAFAALAVLTWRDGKHR